MKRFILASLLILTIAAIALAAATCPVHGLGLYFDGNVRTVDGVLLKEYRCPRGETYWLR